MMRTSNCALLLIYLPRKNEKLSRPGWLTYSGRFTHIKWSPTRTVLLTLSDPRDGVLTLTDLPVYLSGIRTFHHRLYM